MRPHSLQMRLVAICAVATIGLMTVATILISTILTDALVADLDRTLDARTAQAVIVLRVDHPPQLAVLEDGGGITDDGFTAVFEPDGTPAVGAAAIPALRHAVGTSQAGRTQRRTATVSGERLRLAWTGVRRAEGTWLVVTGADFDPVKSAAAHIRRVLAIAAVVFVAVVVFGAWLVTGYALRPVTRMRADADALGTNDLAGRITEPHAVELAALARTFNGLLSRIYENVRRQRHLVADASHELRTPLAVLRAELELADRPTRTPDELRDAIRHASAEVERLSALADDLLFLARADGDQELIRRAAVRPRAVLVEAAKQATPLAEGKDVAVTVDGADTEVRADPVALRRALDNLLANALRFTPRGGCIALSTARRAEGFTITVSDTGPGFAPEFLPRALDRFSRADGPAAAGSGLGLAIVAEIARAHGGMVTVANRADGGAEVVLDIPDGSTT